MTEEELLVLCRSQEYHYDCEDCWYSCPKSGNCCNNTVGDECNCGYDRRVKEKMALCKACRQAAMEEAKENLRIRMLDPYLDGFEIIASHKKWLDAQVKKEGANQPREERETQL